MALTRTHMSGQPSRWLMIEEAITYQARRMVAWSLGRTVATYHGGIARATGERSVLSTASIIAIRGAHELVRNERAEPTLSNTALYARDRHVCAYCGERCRDRELSRDHIVPVHSGGRDRWMNVADRLPRLQHAQGWPDARGRRDAAAVHTLRAEPARTPDPPEPPDPPGPDAVPHGEGAAAQPPPRLSSESPQPPQEIPLDAFLRSPGRHGLVLFPPARARPSTGRSQFMIVPESTAIASSATAYVEMLSPIQQQGKLDNDPAVTRRIVEITERLIPPAIKYRPETAQWAWSVKVIDDPKTVNAWCMAGGRMAFYTGLIVALAIRN